MRHPQARRINRASSVIYGNLLLALVTAPALINGVGHLSARNIEVMAYLGIVQIGIAYSLLTLGIARGVKSLDASVIGYIEPVLNPIWVFIFLREQPSRWALLGGAIIIVAVFTHTLWNARARMNDE